MQNRRVRGLTFILSDKRHRGRLRLDGVSKISHHKARPPLDDIERAARHAMDSARLEGVAVGAEFLRTVIDEALEPVAEYNVSGSAVQREK